MQQMPTHLSACVRACVRACVQFSVSVPECSAGAPLSSADPRSRAGAAYAANSIL